MGKLSMGKQGKVGAAIDNIALIIRPFLTEELKDSIQHVLNAINNTMQNGVVDSVLKKFNTLLAEESNLNQLIAKSKSILNEIDDNNAKGILNGVVQLIDNANDSEVLENVVNAMKTIHSMDKLIDVAKTLIDPTKIALYGLTGGIVGFCIMQAIELPACHHFSRSQTGHPSRPLV